MSDVKYRKPKGGVVASASEPAETQSAALNYLLTDINDAIGLARTSLRTDLIYDLQTAHRHIQSAINRLLAGRPKHYPEK